MVVRDELRDAPGGGAVSDWTGGMSGLSLRFQKDMLVGVVKNNGKLWPDCKYSLYHVTWDHMATIDRLSDRINYQYRPNRLPSPRHCLHRP